MTMNAREKLLAAADWLGWQHEDLSFGLKTGKDALKLYDYAQAHPDLDEMSDNWSAAQLRKAIGYDPLSPNAKHYDNEQEITA